MKDNYLNQDDTEIKSNFKYNFAHIRSCKKILEFILNLKYT